MPNNDTGKLSKMTRQLKLYYLLYLHTTGERRTANPKDLMLELQITSRRMLERDFKDIRDSGLLNAKYDRKDKRYYFEKASLDKTVEGPRKAHLLRLFRLGTLISKLSMTDYFDIECYEDALKEYQDIKTEMKVHPPTSPEDREDMKEELENAKIFVNDWGENLREHNLTKEYYELFPESNERTRQRDFKEINNIPNFHLYYDKRVRNHIYYVYDDIYFS